jgi:hypothetical protein
MTFKVDLRLWSQEYGYSSYMIPDLNLTFDVISLQSFREIIIKHIFFACFVLGKIN